MANKTITATIKHRQATAATWESKNPVLAAGEFGYDTTNKITKIGDGCIIGAGTVIPGGKVIPEGSVVFGNPYKIVRQATEEDKRFIRLNAKEYRLLAETFAGEGETSK